MLLKIGLAMMAIALAFAAVTAGVAVGLRDAPEPAIAADPAASSSLEPLIRSYTLEDRAGEAEGQPAPESEPLGLQAQPEQNPEPKQGRESAPEPPPEPQSQA